MISQQSISAMGKVMASDFIEFMECDTDFHNLCVIKAEQFMAENGMTMDSDLEADLVQSILENVSLVNG